MTIRKKDGSVYVLDGPNKLTKNQEVWDMKKLIFHNFAWDEITWQFKSVSKIAIPKKNETSVENETPVTNNKIIDEIKKQIIEETKAIETIEEPVHNDNFPILKHKVLMHCLPAEIKKHEDKLYGESWETLSYGKKFIFPSVLLENNDLMMQFWTSDPKEQINIRSIIFPFSYEILNKSTNSYDRVPYDEHRWWKITNKEKQDEGGWIFTAVPSQDQPDFSD